jgi:FKBP-type peptidyl-prolyl cis-trans isomerase
MQVMERIARRERAKHAKRLAQRHFYFSSLEFKNLLLLIHIMKKTLRFALSAAALCFLASCGNKAASTTDGNTTATTPTTTTTTSTTTNAGGKFSTAFGNLVGGDLAKAGVTADYLVLADFTAAAQAAWDKKPMLDMKQATQTMQKVMEPVQKAKEANLALPTLSAEDKAAFSKALGTLLGDNVGQMGAKDFNAADFSAGFAAALSGKPSMTQPEAEAEYKAVMMAVQAEKTAALNAQKGELEKAGKEFLAKNKDKKGVTTTPSGLQYEVLKAGKGGKPTLQSKVKVHYHGTLIDGTVFDSSVDRGEPIEFPLGNVIQGWQEGVQLMPVGSKYRLYIPHEIAYGAQAQGKIPAFSTLIFDVELLGIQ